MKNGLKFDGAAPALLRHVFYLLGGMIAGAFSIGLIYSDVVATGKKSDANEQKIEAIRNDLGSIKTQQGVISQKIDDEKEDNKEFRDRTDSALGRILDRLPRRDGPQR